MIDGKPGIPGNSEDMALFFDTRAQDYERHMQSTVEDFADFYRTISEALPEWGDDPKILDLGIGTGLELEHLFERFPQARITGIDLSQGMLDQLSQKARPWIDNLTLKQGSFLDLDPESDAFDAVISSMALHHWIPRVKLDLYRRIYRSLLPGGVFVNGDYIVPIKESSRQLAAFAEAGLDECHQLHIDLPLSIDQERDLLVEAGFASVSTLFERPHVAILTASKNQATASTRYQDKPE